MLSVQHCVYQEEICHDSLTAQLEARVSHSLTLGLAQDSSTIYGINRQKFVTLHFLQGAQ